jgi:rhodanese-related sulfurtransferase
VSALLAVPRGSRGIDEILDEARARLERVGPAEAFAEFRDGALLVDIRPAAQRAAEGSIPGTLIVERNVLEWRFDPRSDARLPVAGRFDLRIIVVCSEGYTSSLAAAALQDLGLHRATDLAGGFQAWRAKGLPTTSPDVVASDPQDATTPGKQWPAEMGEPPGGPPAARVHRGVGGRNPRRRASRRR